MSLVRALAALLIPAALVGCGSRDVAPVAATPVAAPAPVETLTQDQVRAVLGAVEDANRAFDADAMKASTAEGTVGMLINAGPFHKELTRLSREEVVPLLGSSANLSGTGTRFRVEDIQDELRRIADITIDYGLRRYHVYRRAGTLINFSTMEVVRIGACYELISGVLKRWFGVELPPDPGVDALPSGHIDEFRLKNVT